MNRRFNFVISSQFTLWRQAVVALVPVLVLFTSEFVSQNTSQMPGRFALYVLLLHILAFYCF